MENYSQIKIKNTKILDPQLREILFGSLPTLFIRLINIFFGFIFFYIIADLYSTNIMGLFAISQTLLFIISIFTRLGLDTTIIRLINQKDVNDH